jgi:hypothetical protein
MKHTDASPPLRIICDDFRMSISILDLEPKSRYVAFPIATVWRDVVEGNQAAGFNHSPVNVSKSSLTPAYE